MHVKEQRVGWNGSLRQLKEKLTSAQIFPTVEMVSTGYNPRKVSAPRRIASLPEPRDNTKYA